MQRMLLPPEQVHSALAEIMQSWLKQFDRVTGLEGIEGRCITLFIGLSPNGRHLVRHGTRGGGWAREGGRVHMLTVLLVAGAAGMASVIGGFLALWRPPTTLLTSVAFGFTGGLLIATVTFEMLPESQDLAPLGVVAMGFALGFSAIYAFDLFIHRGALAGHEAEQRPRVEQRYRERRPRGDEATVLAGGTSFEEIIEGLSIGVSVAVEPRLAILLAIAIGVDNLSEGLSIGEIIRGEAPDNEPYARRVLGWTGAIAGSLFSSAVFGWFLLRHLPESVLAFLLAFGGGGILYLTITDLVPTAQARHYQQSAALATGVGVLFILILSALL